MKMICRSYAQWRTIAANWANGHSRFLGVFGTPGLSKTFTLKSVLGDRCQVVRCHGTPLRLVEQIYDANQSQRIILLDDIDSLLQDKKTLNVLKGLFDTDGEVQWNSTTRLLPDHKKNFLVSVKVAVISNEERVFTKHLQAVEDRGIVVQLAPDAWEVHRDVGEWWSKATKGCANCPAFDSEVFKYLEGVLNIIRTPSQRAYLNSAAAKRDGLPWQQIIQDTYCLSPLQQLVRELMLDPTLSGEERVARFISRTEKSRATYFRLQAEITEVIRITPVPTDHVKRLERLRREEQASIGPPKHDRPEPKTSHDGVPGDVTMQEQHDSQVRPASKKPDVRKAG